MPHETPLISTIVAGLVLAFIFGAIANRLRMPPLVGYLVAGVLVGPYTPGFIADAGLATELSEIGVILLMFGVGLHFSLKDLLSVRALAIPGAIVQIGGATILGIGLALLMGWSIGAGLIFGLALSVASTVVLLKALQDRRLIDSERGRIAVGWLIVEDLAMVLALVLIPAFATALGGGGEGQYIPADPFVSFVERISGIDLGLPGVLLVTVIKLAAFVGFMLVVGRRVIPFILHATAHTGSRELFRLAVLAIALGVAAGAAYLFGVSLALGAFFAGMILSESELSHRAAQESLPLRDAFAVLFFVSVGMLFDPGVILSNPLPVIATVLIVIVGKSLLAFWIVMAFRRPVGTALTISASLAQIGEFSFILAALGVSLGILPPAGRDLILAGAIISIILNPLVFWALDRARPAIEARSRSHRMAEPASAPRTEPALDGEAPTAEPIAAAEPEDIEIDEESIVPTTLSGHTILAGFGRVGTVIAEGLLKSGTPFCLIEDAEGRILAARALGIEVIIGNAASPDVLRLANVAGARDMLIAIPNAFEAGQTTEQARRLNPAVRIIARAHSDDEEGHLEHLGANRVIMGEREIALGMLAWLSGERSDVAAAPAEPVAKLKPAENIVAAAVAAAPLVVPPLGDAIMADDSLTPEETAPDAEAVAVVEETPEPTVDVASDPEDTAADLDAVPVPTIGNAWLPTPEPYADPGTDVVFAPETDAGEPGIPQPPLEVPPPSTPVEAPQPTDPQPAPIPEEAPSAPDPMPPAPPLEVPPDPAPTQPSPEAMAQGPADLDDLATAAIEQTDPAATLDIPVPEPRYS